MTLGQKIRNARIERGMTQKQLVGNQITRNMLSKIENDSATPSMKTLEFLARQLGLPTGYFMSDFSLSDGTSPDGLDPMRAAFRDGKFTECIALLEDAKTAGSTDEGYLLHALACIGAAKAALDVGDVETAKEQADAADYYNKQGLYYNAGIDAEMSLILAECSLLLDISEFEKNAADYERAVKDISFAERYDLARAEYLLHNGENELAEKLISKISDAPKGQEGKLAYIRGLYALNTGDTANALTLLKEAERLADGTSYLRHVYKALEKCCLENEDYKGAYMYASKQLRDE